MRDTGIETYTRMLVRCDYVHRIQLDTSQHSENTDCFSLRVHDGPHEQSPLLNTSLGSVYTTGHLMLLLTDSNYSNGSCGEVILPTVSVAYRPHVPGIQYNPVASKIQVLSLPDQTHCTNVSSSTAGMVCFLLLRPYWTYRVSVSGFESQAANPSGCLYRGLAIIKGIESYDKVNTQRPLWLTCDQTYMGDGQFVLFPKTFVGRFAKLVYILFYYYPTYGSVFSWFSFYVAFIMGKTCFH